MIENKSCKSNHKAESKNFVKLFLFKFGHSYDFYLFWLDFGVSKVDDVGQPCPYSFPNHDLNKKVGGVIVV